MRITKRQRLFPVIAGILDSEATTEEKTEKLLDMFCPTLVKKPKEVDPKLFQFASFIANLCGLNINNGSKGECFKSAKILLTGTNPPEKTEQLLPLFGRGGAIYREFPWNKGTRLSPMHIAVHWPRLSGSVKPPEANDRRRYIEGEYSEFIEH
jgi:hypothetical protein